MVSKVAAILRSFEGTKRPQTLSAIAEAADLPLSSAHRIVSEMVEEHLLSKLHDGRYSVDIQVWSLSQTAGHQLRGAAQPFVQDLYSLTGFTSHLAVRDGRDSLYVIRLYGSKRIARSSWTGSRLPLHTTAVGKVLLAYTGQWLWETYDDQRLASFTRYTITDPAQLRATLHEVLDAGFATTHQEHRLGTASLAVPVFHKGTIGAALGIVGPAESHQQQRRHLPTLQELSRQIERATSHIPLDTLLSVYPHEQWHDQESHTSDL